MRGRLRAQGAVVWGLILVVLALGATPLVWAPLDQWIQARREVVWERLETLVGRQIVYDRIAPPVLAALDFQNVRILAEDGTPLLTAASIRLSIDWLKFFQGSPEEALRSIQIINAVLTLDARRDQALLDRWIGFLSPQEGSGGPSLGFGVEGFNITGRWTDGNRSWALDRGFLVLASEETGSALRYRGALSWSEKNPGSAAWASLVVRGELRSDRGFRNLNARMETSQVRTSWLDLEPLTVQLALSPDSLVLTKVADRIPLDLQVSWDRESDRWAIRGAAEEFQPGRLVHLKGTPVWSGAVAGTYTGRFSYQIGGDLSLSGRGLWPDGVLPAPFDRGPVVAEGEVRTENGLYRFDQFRLAGTQVSLKFTGTLDSDNLLPDGQLTLSRWTVPGVGQARGTVQLSRSGTRVDFSGNALGWNDLGTASPVGWVEKRQNLWFFSVDGPWDGTSGGRFVLEGDFDPRVPNLEVRTRVEALPLSLLARELRSQIQGFDLPEEIWGLMAGASARLRWSPRGLEITEGSFAVSDPQRPGRAASGTLAWSGNRLDLNLGKVSWNDLEGEGRLGADFGADGTVDWSLEASAWGKDLKVEGRWTPSDRVLVFRGAPGISGVVRPQPSGGWAAEVALSPFEVAPGWTLGFLLRAHLSGSRWSVEADRVDVTGRYPWSGQPFAVSSRAAVDNGSLRLDDLVLADSSGVLAGSLSTSWSADFSRPWIGSLDLETPESQKEKAGARWSVEGWKDWSASLSGSGFDLARFPIPQVQGRITMTAEARSQDGHLEWSAKTALSEARWGDTPLGFRAVFSGDGRTMQVRDLNLSANPVRVSDGSFDWAGDGAWTSSLGFGLRFGASDWESRWTASGFWAQTDGPPRLSFDVKASRNTWAKKAFPDWGVTVSWKPEEWSAAMDDGGLVLRGTDEGTFRAKAKQPFPLQGDFTGIWNDSQISLDVRGFRADLGLLKDFVNTPPFSLTGGVASGDFSLEGTPTDPELNGKLVLEGLSATSSFLRQPIGPVSIPVLLQGHRLLIDPIDIGPGNLSWIVSGAARLDHFVPEDYQLTVQTDSLSPLPVSYQYTGISATGGVTGLLVVRGTPMAVTLGGKLVLQDAAITLKDSTPSGGGQPGLGFNADLTLVTGRKVEFLWPNESLPLLRAVTASNQTLMVKANDVASTWSVNGKLALKAGEINYLNRTFVLKEGSLGFQESQAGFDPRINVRAEWRYRETEGYSTISLRADGTLSRFSPRFDAVPYKSPEELQQLVGTTLALPTEYTKAGSVDSALSVASDVGTSFLLTPFEETVKKNFKLDLFTVKTEILKKSLLNRNGPLEASDYLDNTRLFFGKYIGEDLFLQGTLAFRQETDLAGQSSTGMVVEPEFQMEFQTPFFLLNWTLLPQHPETLFVTDNTVTFKWNWSY